MKKSASHIRILKFVLFLTTGLLFLAPGCPVKKAFLPSNKNNPSVPEYFSGNTEASITDLTFFSKSLRQDRKMQIYLPDGYDQKSDNKYPVIYFLHGSGQNSYSERSLFSIFNDLVNSKTISPVIIVKPDGSCPPWESSYFTNSSLNGNFEDYIVYDLVEYIDSAFNTIASRDRRTIMGWSAGGMCAMQTAFKHPDVFCGAVSHSGRLDMQTHSLYISGVLSENGGAPVSSFNPNAGPMSMGVFSMAGAFSPDLNNPPWFVDLPFDGNGNFVDSTWNRWLMNDCSSLARKISKEDDLAIYFDCGKWDETMAYLFNTHFADSLDKLGLPYKFESFDGGHYDRNERYPVGLAFLDSVMHRIITDSVSINK